MNDISNIALFMFVCIFVSSLSRDRHLDWLIHFYLHVMNAVNFSIQCIVIVTIQAKQTTQTHWLSINKNEKALSISFQQLSERVTLDVSNFFNLIIGNRVELVLCWSQIISWLKYNHKRSGFWTGIIESPIWELFDLLIELWHTII